MPRWRRWRESAGAVVTACDDCLRRTALIAAIAGRLALEFKTRGAPARVLALSDEALLAIGASDDVRRRYAGFDPGAARAAAAAAGLKTTCRCRAGYPPQVRELADPPAVLHVLGDRGVLRAAEAVAVVGARRASSYGLEVSRALGRGLSAARVPVVSGLALGIDSAAHAGALDAPGVTIGVLAGGADVPYPARGRRLHAAVAARGAVVSELPPGTRAHRWCFIARNRIIAALSAVTVVVQATERSGSLTTADFAAELGRAVAAVPGPVTSRLSAGTHALLHAGAPIVRGTEDVLDLLADVTGRTFTVAASGTGWAAPAWRPSPGGDPPGAGSARTLRPELAALLAAVEDGRGTLAQLAETPAQARAALAGLGELELRGLIRRTLGGRWERAA